MLEQKPQDSAFPDGVAQIWRIRNAAPPGDMPREEKTRKYTLRYRRRTVGIQRYYTAKQFREQIDEVIRCPLVQDVSVLDRVYLPVSKYWYVIRQVQYPENATVPVMDLSLERTEDDGNAAH